VTEIVRAGAERVAELEPLWVALTEHHGGIAPAMGELRAQDDTWRRRREFYERALGEPGIGSALLDRAREEARAAGCTHWGLSVVAGNQAAIRFYRRHGFEVAFLEMLGRP
jgi:GNAT superfamily N-acetyltransferase